MINNVFLLAYLGAVVYFLLQAKRKKENKALNGFGAGMFLVIFIVKAAPVLTPIIKSFLIKT
jgi:hypothetical protein